MDCRGIVPLGVVLMLALTSCAPRISRPSGPSHAPGQRHPVVPASTAAAGCHAASTGSDQPHRCPDLIASASAGAVAAPTAGGVWLGGPRWGGTDAAGQSAPNPELGIEVENFAGSGALRGFQSAEITIHLSQLIELAGKRQKRTRVAALERDLVAWDYEATRIEVLTQVTQAFVEVLSAQQRLRLNLELVRLAEQVLRTAAERVRAGKVSPVEETRAQVALSTSRIALERTQRELDAARARLVVTWGGRTPAFDSAEGTLEPIAAIPSAARLAERIAQNPDIARWATEMAQRQAALDLAGAQRIPDPTIQGGFRRFRETGDNAMVMQFSMPLPIFNRNQGGFWKRATGWPKWRRSAGPPKCRCAPPWPKRMGRSPAPLWKRRDCRTRSCQARNRRLTPSVRAIGRGNLAFWRSSTHNAPSLSPEAAILRSWRPTTGRSPRSNA